MTGDVEARAEALIEVGREQEAIALLRPALSEQPNDPDLLAALVRAYLGVDPRLAAAPALQLIAADPHQSRGHVLASLAYLATDDVRQAVEHAREARRVDPDGLDALHALAIAVSRQGRGRKEGMAAATRAIELYPMSALAYASAGIVEMQQGHFIRARKWFRRALEIDPTDGYAQVNLAQTDTALGALPAAFSSITSLLAMDPRDAFTRDLLDESLYTTLVHLMWVIAVLLWILAAARGI